MKKVMVAGMCLVFASGCYRMDVRTPAARDDFETSRSGVSFIGGLTTVTVNATECRFGIARIDTRMPFWGLLLSAVTVGLVTGMTTTYYCAIPPGYPVPAPMR